jgi:hypothetical protein
MKLECWGSSMKLAVFLSLASAATALPAAAAEAAGEPAPLAALCSAEGAFGQRFGEPVRGQQTGLPSPFRTQIVLGEELRPFTQAEVMLTQDSRRVHRVNGMVGFKTDADARAFVGKVRDAFRDAGWHPTAESSASMGDLESVDLEAVEIALTTGTGNGARRLELGTFGRTVILSCLAPEMTREALREWLAPPVVGQERPQAPALPAALSVKAPECGGENPLANFEAMLPTWMAEWQPYSNALNHYYESLIEWSGQRLVRSGRWTPERKRAFEAELAARPEVSRSMEAILERSLQMMVDLAAVANLEQAGRQREACERVAAMFARIPQMAALTARQSEEIDRIYRAEAKRLGVSLD